MRTKTCVDDRQVDLKIDAEAIRMPGESRLRRTHKEAGSKNAAPFKDLPGATQRIMGNRMDHNIYYQNHNVCYSWRINRIISTIMIIKNKI